ncbi:hypothetical protein CXQ85_004321 [Candidozyma haemuli]|uniref:Uncharacterized protein n=1 Tax=Candidozyma haemuli TaxID=45357 RepID=A0A2V1AU55_9ASCO|nr:hypothetical protein CXQ85_004321 [[Candida] haemuloni]PVH20813.1 hypothetical protein CXQ85_004321 [[Candida] haemuloni]
MHYLKSFLKGASRIYSLEYWDEDTLLMDLSTDSPQVSQLLALQRHFHGCFELHKPTLAVVAWQRGIGKIEMDVLQEAISHLIYHYRWASTIESEVSRMEPMLQTCLHDAISFLEVYLEEVWQHGGKPTQWIEQIC